ncbi:MAG: hypothetical protein ACTSPN_09925 [Promethearchaeota archaeon]
MTENDDLWHEVPGTAYVSLARRGMGKLSLDQCFLNNCDNEDINLLEPIKKEEFEDEKKSTKLIHIKCHKCKGTFILKLETLKAVAKPTDSTDQPLSMGLIYALDEKGNNLGHIGYF